MEYVENEMGEHRKEVGDFEKVLDPLECCRNISLVGYTHFAVFMWGDWRYTYSDV